MPSKQVSVREMSHVLHQLGFVERARRGAHVLLQHPDKGVMINLPTGERYVRLIILRSIEKSLENYHVVNRHEFRKRLGIEGHE
jgi:predicted RNA binding protein YcfA (HicA-like mRNA interferase family)